MPVIRSLSGALIWSLVQNLARLVLTLGLTVTSVLTVLLTIPTAGFAEMADPKRMREVVAQYLRAPRGLPVEVMACEVEFARRGPPRTLFQYLVTLRNPVEGSVWTQVVSGVAYSGERTRQAWEWVQQHSTPPDQEAALLRAAYVPELDLLLQVYPFDHRLPALEPLMVGLLPELRAPLLAQFGPGAWQLEEWSAEPVRYRVDMRASVRLSVRAREVGTAEVAERRSFAKIFGSAEEAERAWGIHQKLATALAGGDGLLAVAPLVAYLPGARVLVQEDVPGRSLQHSLQTPGAKLEEVEEAVRRTARAIAALHRLDIALPARRIELGRTDPKRLRRSADTLGIARPDLAPVVAEIEAGILAGLADGSEAPAVPVHGDLKPSHVVLDGDRVVLLDMDKFDVGEPMLDVTRLLFHLRRGGSAVTGAFVEEYFAHVPAAWELRLAPHYAWDLLEEASTSALRMRGSTARSASDQARQENRINVLLREAQAGLAGRGWWSAPGSAQWARSRDRRAVKRAPRKERRARGGT